MTQGGAVLATGAVPVAAKCLQDCLEQVFEEIKRKIIPEDEGSSLDWPLFSVSIRRREEEETCSGSSEGETFYSRQIVFDREDGLTVEIVLSCSCPGRQEWVFLLCYLIDAAAKRLYDILCKHDTAFLLGKDFHFYSVNNAPEDEAAVAEACLVDAYQLIGLEMRKSFRLSLDVIDKLSLTNYEQESAKGVVLVAPQSLIARIEPCIWLCRSDEPAVLSAEQIRFVRKLMAGAAPDALLFSTSPENETPCFCGVVSLSNGLPPKLLRSSCVQVTIYGPMKWELSMCGQPTFLRNSAMGFQLPRGFGQKDMDEKAKHRIEAVLRKEFSNEPPDGPFCMNIGKTVQAVMAVREQAHGAAAVVAAWGAPNSCCQERLDTLIFHQKAIPVTFKAPSGDSQKRLAAAITQAAKMDGAVLIDALSGEVYALAVILDGLSHIEGNPSRGARFNSLKNFTRDMSDCEIVSFVFSSDGGMDIFSGQAFRDGT